MWVWGCALIIAALSFTSPATAEIAVPSGQSITLTEVLTDSVEAETLLRFRFLAPGIARGAGEIDFDTAVDDMAALCRSVALPYLAEWNETADLVVVSLTDRPVPFGASEPGATQFFEAYRVQGGDCIWEGF